MSYKKSIKNKSRQKSLIKDIHYLIFHSFCCSPKVQSKSALPVHIFAPLSSTDQECHHDVTVLSNKSFTGSKEYCFQMSLSGLVR